MPKHAKLTQRNLHPDAAEAVRLYGMRAMQARIEELPFHAVKTNKISAQLIAYYGVLTEAIESVYSLVDQIVIAYGRCPEAERIDDGSLDRIRSFPDPDHKIRLEVRDIWHDKKVMREWCSSKSTGNHCLILDGDEVWTGLDKLLEHGIMFGSPRWCNLWHGGQYWVYDVEGKGTSGPGSRWGYRVRKGQPGSYAPHYRWSWHRPSFVWRHHSIPASSTGDELYTRNSLRPPARPTSESEVCAQEVPECMIYHLGHALPKEIMAAKHSFYRKRDGDDVGRQLREKSWHEWDGKPGDCADGMVKKVSWELPDIVQRAVVSAARMKVK